MSLVHSPRIASAGLQLHIDPALTKSWKDRSYNLHPNPLDIYGYCLSTGAAGSNCKLSRETTFTSPAGGIPLKMEVVGNDAYITTYNNTASIIAPTKIGETWTVSVWARADRATTGQIFQFGSTGGVSFNEAPATTFNITTDWQRFSYTYTILNAATTVFQTRLDGPDIIDNATIWWDGWQVEKSSTMSTFTAKTSSILYDLSSNSYNATAVNNPSYISDNRGILALDGVKDYITFPSGNQPTISTTAGFTIGMWVFQAPTQVNAAWNYFYFSGPLEMGTFSTTGTAFILKDNSQAGSPTVNSGTVTTGWNYIAFGTNSSQIPFMYHYNATTSTYTTANAFTSATYTIDKLFQGGSTYYGAKFGPIQIYNRALTAAEVVQNFNALRGRYGV